MTLLALQFQNNKDDSIKNGPSDKKPAKKVNGEHKGEEERAKELLKKVVKEKKVRLKEEPDKIEDLIVANNNDTAAAADEEQQQEQKTDQENPIINS